MKELQQVRYAHRGLHNAQNGVPENSMPAFRRAVEQGYGIELDVHLSKDGKLVVEHDDTLRRTCGVDLRIEDTDWSTLQTLTLEGTDRRLPLLEEVFALVDGRVPLLIEAKIVGGNWNALGSALTAALERYRGPFCVESFEPRFLLWLRRHAPHIVRGQLAGNVRNENNRISPVINFVLKNLLIHLLSRPDFVAYNYKTHRNLSFRICRLLYRPPLFLWTVKTPEGEAVANRLKATPIFEDFR